MAYYGRRVDKGLLHHSDGGGQDAGHESQDQLKQSGMTWSMSRKGNSWENSVVESFFHPLKTECTHQKGYLTGEEARVNVIDQIEMFDNSHRLHSTLGPVIPNDFENEIRKNAAQLRVHFYLTTPPLLNRGLRTKNPVQPLIDRCSPALNDRQFRGFQDYIYQQYPPLYASMGSQSQLG